MRIDLPRSITNDHLNTIETDFKRYLSIHANEIEDCTPSQILDLVFKRKNNKREQIKMLDYVDQYYLSSVSNRSSIEESTKKNYLKAIKHLKNHFKLEGISNLTFKEFEFKHASNFKNYLLNDIPALKKKGMTEESAFGNVKKFRTIFDQAIEENLLEKNYFKKIKFSCKPTEKPRFSIDQVKSLYELNRGKISEHEEMCRDLILFSSFTGLAFQDTTRLPKTCLEVKETGEIKLMRPRTKTSEYVEQFLSSFAIDILEKYKNHPKVDTSDFALPSIDNSTYNKTLKILALKAKIDITVTTHTGRHSFRQLLSEANIDDYAVIKRMMGQKNRDVVDAIYYKVTESRLFEAKRKFQLFLGSSLKNCENDNNLNTSKYIPRDL
jgi:integrase/recombinase XerD